MSTERQYGMGIGPVPESAVRNEAAILGLDEVEAEMFSSVMRRLDAAFLREHASKTGSQDRSASTQVSSRPASPELFDALFG